MFTCPRFVRERQYGTSSKIQWKDAIYSTFYKSFGVSSVTATTPVDGQDWGAVFGCGFSPDGYVALAIKTRILFCIPSHLIHPKIL